MKSFITLRPGVLYGHPCISVGEDSTVICISTISNRNAFVNTLVDRFHVP